MPINWNEIDKLKLEYIQNKEAVETEYKKECLACLNSLFRKPKKPKELDPLYYNNYQLYKDRFICVKGDNIILYGLSLLPSELKDSAIEYLNPNKGICIICDYEEKFLYVIDTEENRKKIDKVVAFIEKYLENKKAYQKTIQKRAEAFIDSYINSKDTK